MTVDEVNALDEAGFLAAFGHVYEDSPALAATAFERRPFADRDALVGAFDAAAGTLDDDAVLALLRAHPQLAMAGPLTASSTEEQAGAGLTGDDPVLDEIRVGNRRYVERFGFPFIIAVRGLGPADVMVALAERLEHDEAEEWETALAQVRRIAALRIDQVLR
jgi:OHCU decarboxylase